MAELPFEITKAIGIIVGFGIAAQWLSWRYRIPTIFLLTLFGFFIGPIFGWLKPDETFGSALHPIIDLAVAIILFEGGLQLRFHELKKAAKGISRLISFGLLFQFILGSLAAHYIAELSWSVSILISAILVVTGPTVIIPALRQAKLAKRPASFLKWEGIINDPLGALLAILIFEYLIFKGSGSALTATFSSLSIAILVSLGASWLIGNILRFAFQKALVPDFLKVPMVFVTVILSFIVTDLIQNGTGLLTTTFLGVYLGNKNLQVSIELRQFKESVSIFAVSAIFILLTATLDLSILTGLTTKHLFYLLSVLFLVRPLAIFLATIKAKIPWRERLLVGWFAPRGIVAASIAGVVGTKLSLFGYPDANYILPLVFLIIVITVVCHGFSLNYVANWLGLSGKTGKGLLIVGGYPWSTNLACVLHNLKIPVLLLDSAQNKLSLARKQGIPTHHGEIINDLEDGKLDLTDFDCLLAATDNDAYNALICTTLANDLEHSRVFQLPFTEHDPRKLESLPPSLRGVLIKNKHAHYNQFMEKYHQGWRFKKSNFKETLNYSVNLENPSPKENLPFLVLNSASKINFLSTDNLKEVKENEIVIRFTMDKSVEQK